VQLSYVSSSIGCQFANGSSTSWPSSLIRRDLLAIAWLYLSQLIHHYQPTRTYAHLIFVPKMTQALSAKAFTVSAPSIWNSLSYKCRSAELLSTVKRTLKTELFDIAYSERQHSATMRLWFACDYAALYKCVFDLIWFDLIWFDGVSNHRLLPYDAYSLISGFQFQYLGSVTFKIIYRCTVNTRVREFHLSCY